MHGLLGGEATKTAAVVADGVEAGVGGEAEGCLMLHRYFQGIAGNRGPAARFAVACDALDGAFGVGHVLLAWDAQRICGVSCAVGAI